jgi:hypothetical protein
MAEYSWSERIGKVFYGPVLFAVWLYLSPDYSIFILRPLIEVPASDFMYALWFLIVLLLILYGTISWI